MGKSLLQRFHKIYIPFLALVLLLGHSCPAAAENGKLFFSAIVERDDSANPQVVLEWGALEGEIPADITSFRLYRAPEGGDFSLLAEIPHELADPTALKNFIYYDIQLRVDALVADLTRMNNGEPTSVPGYLHDLLDPGQPEYDSLKVMLLTRSHLAAARALGLAFIDDTVSGGSYHYLLTAVTGSGESLPIGQTGPVNSAEETILPPPTGLCQVHLSSCSALGGGLDDQQINFSWDIADAPQDLGLKAITYGYDLFWSAINLGNINFRNGIPANLYPVNPEPVVVAGPPPDQGPDSFLAKDGPENHEEGPAWKRGQSYFYYLVARDIAGHYSASAYPVELTVVDAMPPRAVWNAHTLEVKDPVDNVTPRLALVWDAPTATNFSRYFGNNRTICSADSEEICWVSSGESCAGAVPRCADLAVDHYRIFRFASPREAAQWGIDTDGDYWPDGLENDPDHPEDNTDSCDGDDHPEGKPSAWIKDIVPDDPAYARYPGETHRQIFYIDYDLDVTDPEADIYNRVFWYRIIAVDEQGNQSPLSPPLRGVIYDRTQPLPQATIAENVCSYTAGPPGECEIHDEEGDVFILQDKTGDAAEYKFFQQCAGAVQLLAAGPLNNGIARIKEDSLPDGNKCAIAACSGSQGFFFRFYDDSGRILAATEPAALDNICTYNGCVILDKTCQWVGIGDPYHKPEDNTLQLCVPLLSGQSARVYYQTPEGMSPFYTFAPADDNGTFCNVFTDLAGLTSDDICLGLRIFSANHVGSIMLHLGCLEMSADNNQPPPRPFLDAPESINNEIGNFFTLHWSMPIAGIGSYILKIKEGNNISYKSLWDVQPDDSGRYQSSYHLASEEMDKELCFQVRALGTDMQVSAWSDEQCDTWHSEEPANLPWPPVAEPVEAGSLGAFFMQTTDDRQPVLVLSDNLVSEVDRIMTCINKVSVCYQKTYDSPCLRNTEFEFIECPACSIIRAKMPVQDFIVYRQESGHDFIQVSPLVEGFFCRTEDHGEIVDVLQDPFITLLDVEQNVVTGVTDPVAIGAGIRILFKDRYPYRVNSRIRYKLVGINHETGEPEKVFTSNWVDIP